MFRFLPDGERSIAKLTGEGNCLKLSQLQLRLRRKMLESGFGYLTQTTLNDDVYLRCTIMNPLTNRSHLKELLAELRRIGPNIWAGLD